MEVLISPHHCQLLFSIISILVILADAKWFLLVFLFCFCKSLITNFSLCLLAIFTSILKKKKLFRSSFHFELILIFGMKLGQILLNLVFLMSLHLLQHYLLETLLFSLNCLSNLLKYQVMIYVWVYSWPVCLLVSICLSIHPTIHPFIHL